jgi:hypothetical protein
LRFSLNGVISQKTLLFIPSCNKFGYTVLDSLSYMGIMITVTKL